MLQGFARDVHRYDGSSCVPHAEREEVWSSGLELRSFDRSYDEKKF